MLSRFKNVKGLTNLIGAENLLINIHGKIKDIDGEDVPYTVDEEGYICVNIDAWDGKRNYRILDLIAIQFKCYDLPPQLYKEIVAFPIDNDKGNHYPSNVGYRFRSGRLEVPGHPGFYYIPGFLRTAIDRNLRLLYIPKKEIKNWYISTPRKNNSRNIKGGYRLAIVPTLDVKRASLGRHRASLLVFDGYPDNVDDLIANHKNGVPGDDYCDNLEWMTRRDNNIHAYETNLKTQNLRVLSRNVFTGEIIEYRSISECAARIGLLSDESMRGRLYRSKFCQVFSDGLQFKLKNDKRPWIIPTMDEIEGIGVSKGVAVDVYDTATGLYRSYSSVKLAHQYTGINKNFIRDVMLSGRKPIHKGYYIRIKSNDPLPVFSNQEINDSYRNTQKSILVKNLKTDDVTEFDNIREVREFLKASGFIDGLRIKGWSLSGSEYLVKYRDNVEWPDLGNIDDVLYRIQPGAAAKCEKTGKIFLAKNCTDLAKNLGLNPKSVTRAASTRGSVVHKGYRIRRGINTDPWPEDK